LCAPALEYPGGNRLRLFFDRIPETLIPAGKQRHLREVLSWYCHNHPLWFSWLELV